MRSISIKAQFSNTKHIYNYNRCDGACSYIAGTITRKPRLLLKIRKRIDLEEETARHSDVFQNDARQKMKHPLQKRNFRGYFTVVDDSDSQ